LLSLWEVHDTPTALFMHEFYAALPEAAHSAAALQRAIVELRKQYPEPCYWAPFFLSGYALRSQKLFFSPYIFDPLQEPFRGKTVP
jgi:CHAT domain-containing protein